MIANPCPYPASTCLNCFLDSKGHALDNFQSQRIAALFDRDHHPEINDGMMASKIIRITLEAANQLMEAKGLNFRFAYLPDEWDMDYLYCRMDGV